MESNHSSFDQGFWGKVGVGVGYAVHNFGYVKFRYIEFLGDERGLMGKIRIDSC